MLFKTLAMATLAAASAVLPSAKIAKRADVNAKLLVSNSGAIRVLTFDGTAFTEASKYDMEGFVPSWLAFSEPNMIFTYDENSNITYALSIDLDSNTIKEESTSTEGCVSPVHLELNADGTRMVASCYSDGDVTIWDISNGDLKLVTTLHTNGDPIAPGQTVARAHQSVMEPSGRFFATNNLGTDTIVIIDGKDDNWDIVNRVRVEPAGCGPRHGSFYPLGAEQATHYMVVCENQNLVHVYSVTYTDSLLELSPVQTVSTFSQSTTANITSARASELVISPENTDVYVSNRLTVFNATDGDQDSVIHFKIVTGSNGTAAAAEADGCAAATDSTGSGMMLKTAEEVPSAGYNPRFIGLGSDADILYVANVGAGPAGLAAFARNKDDGKISTDVMGSVDYAVFGEGPGWGPQFVKQI